MKKAEKPSLKPKETPKTRDSVVNEPIKKKRTMNDDDKGTGDPG